MYKGLNRAGIGKAGNDIEQFICLASKYGFEAIDIDCKCLEQFTERFGIEGGLNFLNKHRVKIASVDMPVEWRKTNREFQTSFEKFPTLVTKAYKLGCTRFSTFLHPSTEKNAAKYMLEATQRLRHIAQFLKIYEMDLALEFVAPYHLRNAHHNELIWTIEDMLLWIDVINQSNVGILLDSFHWYSSKSSVEDILQLDVKSIIHVHINDAPDIPIEEVLDYDRLYPLEGVINLYDFLSALKQIGYNGVVSQEVLTPSMPNEDSEILFAKSARAMSKLFETLSIKIKDWSCNDAK
ncbi:sugar phosphate isomerase/epimerase family protein [Bacillus velezensis]|uniref:sugar phosphate isomerase/epimerase family protein n=1 Tax=Bacillus velezensis TaxID=492670 RepID=UPI000DC4F1E7|nr:sugar phosphate isomerase/epimerase family protein [Bacillus velezensis]MED3509502.1 sugar phosphate isomerase/epimerase [Bacillus velezensis]RAP15256.1 hypothetical protein HS9_00583 [Bacillus velezensis]